MNRSYRAAILCGAVPLLTGISIFLLWLATRWEWLMVAGLLTLYGGVFFFVTGVMALANYCWIALRMPELPKRRVWRLTLACTLLLFSNFAVAGGIIKIVVSLAGR
jgi:hypothetical protein